MTNSPIVKFDFGPIKFGRFFGGPQKWAKTPRKK
jgi:hypothetical protein